MAQSVSRWILTGGIGSGKSTVARLLDDRGVTVIDVDRIGHEVLEPDGAAFRRVASRWPAAVVDGRIDRSRLAAVVFSDPDELAVLESLTHPEIRARLERELPRDAHGPVVVEISVPKLGVKGPSWKWIVVDAPDDLRVRRAVRRGMAERDVRARMAAQPDREGWLALADVVIDNSGSLDALRSQVDALLNRLAP